MLYCKVFLIPYSPFIAYMTTQLKKLILVICFHLGVSGVAISTIISNVISAVMVMIYLYRRDDAFAQATVTSPARTMRGKHQTLQESVLVKHAVWHCLHRDSRSYLHRME